MDSVVLHLPFQYNNIIKKNGGKFDIKTKKWSIIRDKYQKLIEDVEEEQNKKKCKIVDEV